MADEDIDIIRMNIERYRRMLSDKNLDDEKRRQVKKLLAEAEANFLRASRAKKGR